MPRSLTAVMVVLLAAGCSAEPPAASPPSPAVSGTPVIDDAPGARACGSLLAAVSAGTLMVPGVVDTIVRAGTTADAPVADSAQRLAAAYAAAVAAHGAGSEPDAIAAVSAAGADMSGVCTDSGLHPVG